MHEYVSIQSLLAMVTVLMTMLGKRSMRAPCVHNNGQCEVSIFADALGENSVGAIHEISARALFGWPLSIYFYKLHAGQAHLSLVSLEQVSLMRTLGEI